MGFELFVASRYLFAKHNQTFIYVISLMSILGVAIGVAALVVVLGVYNGFTTDIEEKIIGANAHIMVTGLFNDSLSKKTSPLISPDSIPKATHIILEKIKNTHGVIAATPFVYAESMLSSPYGVKGVILRGIEPSTAMKVISMLAHLKEGRIENLKTNIEAPGIIIGNELAQKLQLTVGSRVNLLSASGQKTTSGFQPRIKTYIVVGIFHTGMFEYDTSLGFTSIPAAQDIIGAQSDYISGVEIMTNNPYAAENIAEKLQKTLGQKFSVKSWIEMNANLFAALRLEKIGMFIILTMVVLIGSFSIVTMLIMLVMEKTRDIAILLSMGATNKMIRSIFILQGTIIGIVGTILGYILGISIALLLQQYKFIKLPPGVYTTDYLPIILSWSDTLIIGAAAMTLCFLATIYPAQQAARLQPIEGLRYE